MVAHGSDRCTQLLMRRFATPEVTQDLQESGFALGGKLVQASVMFSDIRGFTSLAESQTPEETIELLNTYYALMFDAISGHGGVVTLMMRDGLMSVRCAHDAAGPLRERGQRGAGNGRADRSVHLEREATAKPSIRIGIGIASGEMVVGYTGTNERATYTCVCDIVNIASRLEMHTKVAQRIILMDHAMRFGLGAGFEVEPLGAVPFKGKAAAVEVYSIGPAKSR